jgi:hypothetical protein
LLQEKINRESAIAEILRTENSGKIRPAKPDEIEKLPFCDMIEIKISLYFG